MSCWWRNAPMGGNELVEFVPWQVEQLPIESEFQVECSGYFFQSDPLVSSHTSLGWVCVGFPMIMHICQAPLDCSSMVGHGVTMHQWNGLEKPAAGRPKCRQGCKMLSHCAGSSCSLVRHSGFLKDGCPAKWMSSWGGLCRQYWPSAGFSVRVLDIGSCCSHLRPRTKYTCRLHQASLDLRCWTMAHCWHTSSMVRQGGL